MNREQTREASARHRTAAVLITILSCFDGGWARAEWISAEMRLMSLTAYGPEIALLLRNENKDVTRRITIEAGVHEAAKCSGARVKDLPWPDPLLESGVIAELQPGAWFVFVHPTRLIWSNRDCEVWAQLKETTDSAIGRGAPLVLREAAVFPERNTPISNRRGEFEITTSVARVKRRSARLVRSTNWDIVQVQIRVANDSENWRDVAVIDRNLACTDDSEGQLLIGPGELPTGMQHGPASMPPSSWLVFTERFQINGDPRHCRVTYKLGEWVGSGEMAHLTGNGIWMHLWSTDLNLNPSVVLDFRY